MNGQLGQVAANPQVQQPLLGVSLARRVWVLLQDPHHENNWRALRAFGSEASAKAAMALLEDAGLSGKTEIKMLEVSA